MRDNIFNQKTELINFCFNAQVAGVFDDMVSRSVPGYNNILELIALLAKVYAQNNTNLYDLGCSTGATSLALRQNKTTKIIAVDNSVHMISKCNNNLKKFNNIQLICSDILNIKIRNSSIVVLNLTLQFIQKNNRTDFIKKIYQGLNHKGILIIAEKVHFKNSDKNKLINNLHAEFKKANGYSKLEIANKRQMLENVLITEDEETHLLRFKKAGFNSYEKILQNLNFKLFIAIKN